MTTPLRNGDWPFRTLLWYYRHPLVGYLLLFLAGTLWTFTTHSGHAIAWTLVAAPWVLVGLLLLHLPLVGGAIKGLTLPRDVRRNHALEHGTVQLLLRSYGRAKGVGGRASRNGFRVSGARDPRDIERAFAEFIALPPAERRSLAVADRCGSMVVATQGLGAALLAATLIAIVVWRPSILGASALLGLQFLLFIVGRRPIGRALQARRLLSLDFDAAYIQRIEKVRPLRVVERAPVYFVRTIIGDAA